MILYRSQRRILLKDRQILLIFLGGPSVRRRTPSNKISKKIENQICFKLDLKEKIIFRKTWKNQTCFEFDLKENIKIKSNFFTKKYLKLKSVLYQKSDIYLKRKILIRQYY